MTHLITEKELTAIIEKAVNNALSRAPEKSVLFTNAEGARSVPCSESTFRRYRKKGVIFTFPILPGRNIFFKNQIKNAIRTDNNLKVLHYKNLRKQNYSPLNN